MNILQIAGEQFSIETSKIINRGRKHRSYVILPQKSKLYTREELSSYEWLEVWDVNKISLFLKMLKTLLFSSFDVLVLHGCTVSINTFPFFEYKLVRKFRRNMPIVFMCHSQDRVKFILRRQIHEFANKDPYLLVTYVSINMNKYLPEGSIYTPQPIPDIFHPNPKVQPEDPPIILFPTGGKWGYKFKGKRLLLKAIRDLSSRGLRFKFYEHKGRIPYSQMPYQYWRSTIVFDQIYDEVYGKVTPEAFMCGRIALNDAHYPTEENTVNANNLADKIEQFLQDEKLRNKVAEKGRSIVLKRHSAANATKLFIKVLKNFVEECN